MNLREQSNAIKRNLVTKSLDAIEKLETAIASLPSEAVDQRAMLNAELAFHYARCERLTTPRVADANYTLEPSVYYIAA